MTAAEEKAKEQAAKDAAEGQKAVEKQAKAGESDADKGKERDSVICFGALGIGGLKLKLHRACVGKLFESSDLVLDAENIYALAKEMA